ncbi:MAG: alpha/beta hydrolase family protein [Rheinheimera sp.]
MYRILSLFIFILALSPALGVAAAQQPNITTLLAKNPAYGDVKISPDGRYLAVILYKDDKRQLVCLERENMKAVGGVKLVGNDEVGSFFWANHERLVMKVISRKPWEKEPNYYGELFGINCDGSQKKLLFGYRAKDSSTVNNSEGKRAWGELIHLLPKDPKHILISSTNWSKSGGAKADVYKLDIYRGKMTKTGRAPIGYADILADNAGIPKVANGTDESYTQRVYLAGADGEWSENEALNQIADFNALRMLPDQSGFYFSGRHQTDLAGLYQFHFADQRITPLYEPENVDVTSALFSTDGESIYAARLDENYPSYLLLNKDSADTQVFRTLTEKFAGADVNLTSRTEDGRLRVVRVEAEQLSPVYFLHDNQTGKIDRLLDSRPHLRGIKLKETLPVEFNSSDKTLIRGYLTLGAAEGSAQPLVVLLHGGPYGVRDYWGFNSEVQMLAMAGYNVLQVNFRASAGYGAAFAEAANHHWGDKVQQDIIAGTRWAISQGVAQQGNICIMGGSFGAYSALQSAALAPELYRCAIGVAGVYDLTLLTKKGDITRLAYGEAYLDRAIGQNEALLKSFSPVYLADKIKAKVLLIHGENDERAPLIHAEEMQEALEETGNPATLSEYDDEGHGFYAEENQIRYYQEVLQHLQTHLKI